MQTERALVRASNHATDEIQKRNEDTLRAIQAFRDSNDDRSAAWEAFSRLKHQHPYFGFVACEAGGIEFVLFSANDDQVAWEYQWFGADSYEPQIVRTWVRWCRERPGVVYDIGAYTGLMSVLAAKAHDANRVHLFEPVPRTIERAKINVRSNALGNRIQLHNKAASDRGGKATINLYRTEDFLGSGNSIFDKELPVHGVKTIECARIDDALPDGSPRQVKIDVEGHELAVLHGMAETIGRARPRMIIETWEHARDDVLRLLTDWDYECEPFEKKDRGVINYRCDPR